MSTAASKISHLFAGITVADYRALLPWYERLFGRPADVVVHEQESMWQVSEAGWIYVVADAARAGRAKVTMLVDDLDTRVRELEARGIAVGELEHSPGRFHRTVITDPEGNLIAFAELMSSDAAAGATG